MIGAMETALPSQVLFTPQSQPLPQQQLHPLKLAFTCSICGKGFDQKRPQIRHLSYCKKSKTRPPKSRKKACLRCTKAKTQCEVQFDGHNRHLQCSRCRSKGLGCRFEQPPFVDAANLVLPSSTLEDVLDIASGTSSISKESYVDYPTSYETAEIPNYELALLDSCDTSSDGSNSTIPSVQFPRFSTNTDPAAIPWTENAVVRSYEELMPDTFLFHPSTPEIFHYGERQYRPLYRNNESLGDSTFTQISLKQPRSFIPSKERDRKLQLARRFITCTIKSYPNMLLGDKLPPFIHCSCSSNKPNSSSGISLSKPLLVCAGIVQMFNFKNKGNSGFIWKTIRTEQERLANEYFQFDDVELVAALQSLTIYMLLRISEEDEDATDFDIPLIQTMMKVSIRTYGLTARQSTQLSDGRRSWKGWALAESLNRTIALICLIGVLFDLSEGLVPHHCDGSQFTKLKLPCSRMLWNASCESEWDEKVYTQSFEQDSGSDLTYGDILNFQLGKDHCGERLDSWLCQVDDFGSLLIAAANLPGKKH